MGVRRARALLEHVLVEHPLDERAEAGRVGVLDEALPQVEGDPARRLDEVERLREGGRRDVAEAECGHARHRGEVLALEAGALAAVEIGDVDGEVVVVQARAVAQRRVARLGQQVEADERVDAERGQPLADHAVARAEVQPAQRRRIDAGLLQLGPEQVADDLGGAALQQLGEELLVEAGNIEDRGVIVKADPLTLTVELDLTPFLVLVQTAAGRTGRERQLERLNIERRHVMPSVR